MQNKTYISLLEGINIEGQNKIVMKDLTLLYESLEFENVETFAQSGNVVFNTHEEADTLVEKIEKAIVKKYGFHVPVQIRQSNEFENIIKACPYTKLDLADGTRIMITFLDALPSSENIEKLMSHVQEPEKLEIIGQESYLYCPNGYGKTKLNNNFLEKILEVNATTRNWKSVMRICILGMGNKI